MKNLPRSMFNVFENVANLNFNTFSASRYYLEF